MTQKDTRMGLHIDAPGASADRPVHMIADRPLLCDTEMTTLMEVGDVRAGRQVASRAGKEIPAKLVHALDLVVVDGRVVQRGAEPVAEKAAEKAEDKQVVPAEDKAVSPAKEKARSNRRARLRRAKKSDE